MAKWRRVRKWGNSFVIMLAPTDAKDNDIIKEGWADIGDIIFKQIHPKLSLKESNKEREKEILRRVKNDN